MKTYSEIEEKIQEYDTKYDELKKERTDEDDWEINTELIIYGHWVDVLSDVLDYNVLDYAEKIGFDIETHDEIFEYTDEVKKEIIMTEDQVKENLQIKENYCKKYPYGSCRNEIMMKGVNLDKLERDILKWLLQD